MSNNSLTITKDLWQIAQKQINKIRPQKIISLANQSRDIFKNKSIDQIFKRQTPSINQILPKGLFKIRKTQKQVPQSIKFLDKYAQRMGFLQMGQVYQRVGNKYVGRIQQITKQGQKFYKPFPQFNQSFIDTPNLTQNLSFRANKAIQKWNQFVSAQAELAQFLLRVSTQQGRKKVIYQYAKTSSIGSDMLKVLSSLYYLYFDPKSSNHNFLGLAQGQIQNFKNMLRTQGQSIKEVYDNLMEYLLRLDKKDDKLIDKIFQYHQFKVQSIKASLRPQQFKVISQILNDTKAFVPDQMIQQPFIQNSQWYQILKKQDGQQSKMIVQNWQPQKQWFKAVNYLR